MKNILTAPMFLSGREAFCVAATGNIVLFAFVIITGFPVFHSVDDLNIAWITGDGFGAGASTCLPFLHNQHYWISEPVMWLFRQFPGVNWFSWSMISTEFASMTAIFYVIMRIQRWQLAAINYLVLFMVYSSFLLYYLHGSSTAVTAVTASLLLSWFAFTAPKSKTILIAASIFFITGALFRLHVVFPLLVVAAPFFLLIKGCKKKWMAAAFLTVCVLSSFLCFWLQQQHYSASCPNWQSEENYRQAKYSNINYYRNVNLPAMKDYRQETALLDALILPDTSFVPAADLQKMAEASRTMMPSNSFFSADTWRWTFINNRIFIAAALLALCFSAGTGVRLLSTILSFLAVLTIIIYLQIVMKLPEFMVPALFFIFFSFSATCLSFAYPLTLRWKFIAMILAGALVCWGILKIWKAGKHNRSSFAAFEQVHAELAAHPDKLFISTGDNEPFFYIHVFATPAKYSFRNILLVDQPLSLRNAALLRDFGYTGFVNAFENPRIFFRGPALPVITQYVENKTSKKYSFSDPLPDFKFSRVCKPIPGNVVIPAPK
ncbi:hypothetical protein [Pseudoflavitalea rhizosphaerae]|uniref:hypothetical protein n=1 Tax=Pseudoflavitalea rhizosphaerae TaxID=1884793 RepID=UPI000F8D6279|nr:hypothetical protein [Pseudoflavitalea rhizosphaerae]